MSGVDIQRIEKGWCMIRGEGGGGRGKGYNRDILKASITMNPTSWPTTLGKMESDSDNYYIRYDTE